MGSGRDTTKLNDLNSSTDLDDQGVEEKDDASVLEPDLEERSSSFNFIGE